MQRCQQVTDLRGAARCPSLCITRQNTTGPEFDHFVFGLCICLNTDLYFVSVCVLSCFFLNILLSKFQGFPALPFDAKNHINLYTYMFPLPKSCHLREDENFNIMCVKMFVICQFVLIQCIFPLSNENT